MGFPKHTRIYQTANRWPAELLDRLADDKERAHVAKVSAYPGTASVVVEDADTGGLHSYAVFGPDDNNMVAVYAAHVFGKGMGPAMFKQIFGASIVLGLPVRVHTERVHAFARAIGATDYFEAIDGAGKPQLVAHG